MNEVIMTNYFETL